MKMMKRQYRIEELAKELKLKKFVLHFWEKELDIKPQRSTGGQRFYQEEDLETFKTIKTLLYERKFTIAGAKKELLLLKTDKTSIIASQKTDMASPITEFMGHQKSIDIFKELINIKQKLEKLKKLL